MGNYSFTGVANGSYTVMPTKTGASFGPANQPVTIPAYRGSAGTVAALLAIRATTHTLVVDQQGSVRYRGNVENAPNPERATQHGLRTALEAALNGQPVKDTETRPIGCAVAICNPSS
jgi:hypothetical protein